MAQEGALWPSAMIRLVSKLNGLILLIATNSTGNWWLQSILPLRLSSWIQIIAILAQIYHIAENVGGRKTSANLVSWWPIAKVFSFK